MRVGIYGGTFNPPHTGHESSAKIAVAQLKLDTLAVIPVGVPPHKPMPLGSPPAEIRLIMARNSFDDLPNTIISDIEAKNANPCYTIDTVEAIKKLYPKAEIFLLMGTDMYLSIETWKSYKSLLENVTPTVFSRNYDDIQKIEEHSRHIYKHYGANTEIVENKIVPVSSSCLRENLPNREGKRYINDTNYSYIIKNRFYNAKPDWQWLREKAYSMLTPKRIPHVAACEKAAVELAKRWGVDIDDARESAILHDITKKFTFEEHVKTLEDNGISVLNITKADEKLLHCHTGAVLAGAIFGASKSVQEAIRWHTTGKAGMSPLAKVLYLADYIEDTRDFPEVDKLRNLAFLSIDDAMLMGLDMTASELRARGITPDKATLDAISDIKLSVGATRKTDNTV